MRDRVLCAGRTWVVLLAISAVCATERVVAQDTSGQPAWQAAAGGKLAFEVASVRQEAPGTANNTNLDLDASDYFRYAGGPIRTTGLLAEYLYFAYKLEDFNQSTYAALNAQLPKWAQSERFHVEARAEGRPTKDQIRLMMQSLLAERFGLRLHRETRQLPMYALVLDKVGLPGAQLRPHPEDTLCTAMPEKSASVAKPATMPPSCMLLVWSVGSLTHMRMMDFSMPLIAGNLVRIGAMMGGMEPLPVVDRTGLDGRFDVDVEFLRAPKAGQVPAPDSQPEEQGITFVEALKRQAGLRLVKQVGPVEVLVVDRLDPPTEN